MWRVAPKSTDHDPLLRGPGFGEAEGACHQLAAGALSTFAKYGQRGTSSTYRNMGLPSLARGFVRPREEHVLYFVSSMRRAKAPSNAGSGPRGSSARLDLLSPHGNQDPTRLGARSSGLLDVIGPFVWCPFTLLNLNYPGSPG